MVELNAAFWEKFWEIDWEISRHRFIKFTKTEKLSGFCKGPRDDSKVKPYRCSRLQMILDRSIDRWIDRSIDRYINIYLDIIDG